jgi:hypothetical protein
MSASIIGLVGVIIGGILTSAKDLVAHFFKQRSNGRYAAVRIVAVLDEYAQKCADVVYDDGTCAGRPAGVTEQGQEYCDPQVTRPEPPNYSDDIDWRSITFNLMYRIIDLPNAAQKTDRYINESKENSYPPDFEEWFSARQEGYAHLGLEAVKLSKILRKKFGFPEISAKFLDYGWDAEKFFQEKLDEFQNRRRADAADEGFN